MIQNVQWNQSWDWKSQLDSWHFRHSSEDQKKTPASMKASPPRSSFNYSKRFIFQLLNNIFVQNAEVHLTRSIITWIKTLQLDQLIQLKLVFILCSLNWREKKQINFHLAQMKEIVLIYISKSWESSYMEELIFESDFHYSK